MRNSRRWTTGSMIGGSIVWVGLLIRWWQRPPDLLATVELLLLLAILVNTPLALSRTIAGVCESTLYRWALWIQPVAALAAAWGLHGAVGWGATLLTLPWLLFTGLLALDAVGQLAQIPRLSTPARIRVAAQIYVPVGAAWLVAYQLGLQPLGFTGIIVLLTAIHFHYTGFTALFWASKIGELIGRPNRLYSLAATGFVAATPLVAAGITLSPRLEIVGVGLLALSLVGLAVVLYRCVLPVVENRVARVLLGVAPLAMLAAIGLAVLYGIGEYLHVALLTIPQMVAWHGWLNGLGFVFTGLIGCQLASGGRVASELIAAPVALSQRSRAANGG